MHQSSRVKPDRKQRTDAIVDGLAIILGLWLIVGFGWWFLPIAAAKAVI